MSEEKSKKKFYKRKLFYAIVLVALFVASIVYGQVKKANTPISYETTKVVMGNLSQTVDATGKVASAGELDLRFEKSGNMAKIYKNVNDKVKAGDIIAELDVKSENAQVAGASASVSQAQANLNKVLSGATDDYVLSIKSTYDKAKASLDQIKSTSADTVANAEAVLRTAENNLKLSEGGEDSQIVGNAYQDLFVTIQSVQNSLSNALTDSDNILGIDNTLANDSFEDVLSALDSSKLYTAEIKYSLAKSAKDSLDNVAISINLNSSHDSLDSAAEVAESGLVATKDLLFA